MEVTERSEGRTSKYGQAAIADSMYLVWENLSVMVPNLWNGQSKRLLLDGLNGYAEPGRIMAIMGPSGSGKSTLLDSLAGSFSSSLSVYPPFLYFSKFSVFSCSSPSAYAACGATWLDCFSQKPICLPLKLIS